MSNALLLSEQEATASRQRRLEAMALQGVEGNPLTPEEIAMFEMFERERWSHARRRAWILGKTASLAAE
jgi:hypothetical protein